jgi:hypothetical protein
MSEPHHRATQYRVTPIGWVDSPLVDREAAPEQVDEGASPAWLVFDAEVSKRHHRAHPAFARRPHVEIVR